MATKQAPARRRIATVRRARLKPQPSKYWSAEVMRKSNALDLEGGVFASNDPRRIALSLKRSALRSERRKAGPFQSAMSMLNFFINRAGRNLPAARKKILAQAKVELRKVFGREAPAKPADRT